MTDREMLRKTLIELVESETGEKYEELDESQTLREGLGLDSVDVVGIVMQIERQFRIRLSQEELEKVVTVGNVLDLVQAKVAAGGATAAA